MNIDADEKRARGDRENEERERSRPAMWRLCGSIALEVGATSVEISRIRG